MKNMKRILKVSIIREMDTDPDTSHYGEYSNRCTSEFSIDRRHSEDCGINLGSADTLQHAAEHISKIRRTECDAPDNTEWESLDEAIDILESLAEDGCTCGGHYVSNRVLPYFNPSSNYVDASGKLRPEDGYTADEVRKYVRRDYDCMESLNNGNWYYVGIRAEAEYVLYAKSVNGGYHIQTVTSGGLWGIESDSDKTYFAEVQAKELSNLREQLKAIGFSTRAISTAFKSVEEVSR